MQTTGNTILITGGGSGIGRSLAHRFHDLGNAVIISGRRRDALPEAAAGRPQISTLEVDVEDPVALEAFAQQVVAQHPKLNVLINNAGVMRTEALAHRRDLGDAEATVITNLLGPIRLTNALVDHLARQPQATVINVTSGLAFVPLSAAPTYSATKAAMHSYTLSLRAQLKGRVEVIELIPPGVQTDLTPGQATRDGYMPLTDYIDEVMDLFQQQPTPAEIAVKRVAYLQRAEAQGRFDQVFAAVNPG